jgi:hypothetical protein
MVIATIQPNLIWPTSSTMHEQRAAITWDRLLSLMSGKEIVAANVWQHYRPVKLLSI